ncbi:stalk domain-containing protein [Moorellaceae bacterium AZ2]
MRKILPLALAVVLAFGLLLPAAWAEGYTAKIKYRDMDDIVVDDFPDIDKYGWRLGSSMGERYPTLEIVEIDGVPWQDSPYAQVIIDHLDYYGNDSYFVRYPDLLEIVLDKRFNGMGHKVWKLYSQGKSVAEIKEILLAEKTGSDSPASNLPPAEPGKVCVVLYLNRKDYSVARDGTWQGASLDVAPVSQNGRTLVPLRGVMEQFGAQVEWVPESKQVKVGLGNKQVVLTLGSTIAMVDGEKVELDVPARVVNGRTMIPLRFVSEQLGMDVAWDGKTQSITIRQK